MIYPAPPAFLHSHLPFLPKTFWGVKGEQAQRKPCHAKRCGEERPERLISSTSYHLFSHGTFLYDLQHLIGKNASKGHGWLKANRKNVYNGSHESMNSVGRIVGLSQADQAALWVHSHEHPQRSFLLVSVSCVTCRLLPRESFVTMSHSPLEEKAGVSKLETIDTGLYDPDAGLSNEERARIVISSPSVEFKETQ